MLSVKLMWKTFLEKRQMATLNLKYEIKRDISEFKREIVRNNLTILNFMSHLKRRKLDNSTIQNLMFYKTIK